MTCPEICYAIYHVICHATYPDYDYDYDPSFFHDSYRDFCPDVDPDCRFDPDGDVSVHDFYYDDDHDCDFYVVYDPDLGFDFYCV